MSTPTVDRIVHAKPLGVVSYVVTCGDAAVVVDPMCDPRPYVAAAAARGATIGAVLLTHIPEDFVSGCGEFGAGVPVLRSDAALPNLSRAVVGAVGGAPIERIVTRGHTEDSCCFLVGGALLFTGDTLALGSVGAPNAAPATSVASTAALLRDLHASAQALAQLPAATVVYPGHTHGSLGVLAPFDMTAESDTIGGQRTANFALATTDFAAFAAECARRTLCEPAAYYSNLVRHNRALLAAPPAATFAATVEAMVAPSKALSVEALEAEMRRGTLVLDVRAGPQFVAGHVPRSVFLGLTSSAELWLGLLWPALDTPFVLVASPDVLRAAAERFAAVGWSSCVGHVDYAAWAAAGRPVATVPEVKTDEFVDKTITNNAGGETAIVDVRLLGEFNGGHVGDACFRPLWPAPDAARLFALPEGKKRAYCHCRTGYRSLLYISLARRNGCATELINLSGGWSTLEGRDDCKPHFAKGGVPAHPRWPSDVATLLA